MGNAISSDAENRSLGPGEVYAQRERFLLIDVRTPAEYRGAHVAGSLLHPLGRFDRDVLQREAEGKSGCVLLCEGGARARQAREELHGSGLPAIAVLAGGIRAWEAAGLPLERGESTIPLERQVRIAAGLLVLLGVLLGAFVHPLGYAVSAFVGAGLVFAGITDTCGMGLLLARMPWNTRVALSACALREE